jgi:hypothetical protein
VPLQNRVTPFGDLIADPGRGLLMGNRGGQFHDPVTRRLTGRTWASRRWLCCSLAYPGRHRHPVWSRGYTQLFFLDEVTALSAGHRPCAECRRAQARAYQAGLRRALDLASPPGLAEIDLRLHGERLEDGPRRRARLAAESLPDGAMIAAGGRAYALKGDRAWLWSPAGYEGFVPRPAGAVEVLTPPLSLAALTGGYAPLWHPSAAGPA